MKKFISTFVFLLMLFPFTLLAAEWPVALEWDSYAEQSEASHFELHEAPAAGGPYDDNTIVMPNINPSSLTTVIYTSAKPDGVATTTYFILKAVGINGVASDPSNEVPFTYDFAPIDPATAFTATVEGDDVQFTWAQADIDRVLKWVLYQSETTGVDYIEVGDIVYTGQAGPQYSTIETMTVPEGEMKTFYFVLITFTKFDVFSQNSAEVSITIDKRKPAPVYNLRIKITTQ